MYRQLLCDSRRLAVLALLPVALIGVSAAYPQTHTFDPKDYPAAKRGETVDELHGVKVADPYRWLEDEQSAETQAWVDAQNDLTQSTLARFADVRKQVAAELEAVYGVDSVSNIRPYRNRYYFTRRTGLENHSKVYMSEDDYRATPKVAINPNEFSEDGTVAMDWWYPSPDGALIAYGKSSSGSEKSTLYIRDVRTGKDRPDVIPFTQYCYVAWNGDGTGFYYNRCPDPTTVPAGEENFHMRVYFHEVGADYQQDRYVWGEGRPIDEEPQPYSSSDHTHVQHPAASPRRRRSRRDHQRRCRRWPAVSPHELQRPALPHLHRHREPADARALAGPHPATKRRDRRLRNRGPQAGRASG